MRMKIYTAHPRIVHITSPVKKTQRWESVNSGPQPDGSLPLPVDAVIFGAVLRPAPGPRCARASAIATVVE
ncbi:hypothetical protein MTO96_028751 [Rhipicephalus appendiculatus]